MEQSQKGSTIKLYYFNLTGRAEHIRYLFAAKGLPYEDVRVAKVDWPNLKPKTPLGGMPVLEVDGKMVGQSLATGRMAAKLTGLYGSDCLEQGMVDSFVETVNELRETGFGLFYTQAGDDKDKKTKDLLEKKIPTALDNMAKFLKDGNYLVNNKLSWADIHFYAVIEVLEEIGYTDLLSKHKTMAALYDRVGQIPGIVAYRKNRPERTDFKK